MTSDPTTTNRVAKVVNDVLRKLIDGLGLDAAYAAGIAAYPWLGWPVIRQIFKQILSVIADDIYKEVAISATKIVIDVQVMAEESEAKDAFQNLQMAIASGDENAIKKASGNLDEAYGNLIHSDGWSAP